MNIVLHKLYIASESYDNEDVNIPSQVGIRAVKKKKQGKEERNDRVGAAAISSMGR